MFGSKAFLSTPRTMGIACALSATLLGLLYLHAAGAPTTLLVVNALSLVMGLALFAVIRQRAQGSRAPGGVVLALGVMLLATAIFGVSVEGASRWVSVGGVSLQPSLILLPGMLVLFARSGGVLATTGIALAALGLALQPDRAMAGIMAAALAVLALYRRERQVVLALTVAGVGFAVTLLRPDSLPAVPYVDQILYTSFEVHPLAGIAVLGGALLLIAPALAGFHRDPTNKAAHAVFGVAWLGTVVAAALGNYPTPVVGYGGSAILGYLLCLSFMPVKARSTAAAKGRSEDLPPSSLALGVIAIVLACTPTPTRKAGVVLSRSDSTLVSIDTADISWRADTASLWIDYYFSRPVPYGDNANSQVYRREVLIDVHCVSSQAQDRRLHVFDKGGNLLHDEVFPTPGWQAFAQTSQTMNVYQPLCTALIPLQPQRDRPAG